MRVVVYADVSVEREQLLIAKVKLAFGLDTQVLVLGENCRFDVIDNNATLVPAITKS